MQLIMLIGAIQIDSVLIDASQTHQQGYLEVMAGVLREKHLQAIADAKEPISFYLSILSGMDRKEAMKH